MTARDRWGKYPAARMRMTARIARVGRSILLAAAVAAAGCSPLPAIADRNDDGLLTVYCLGDSNSDPAWRPEIRKWCELVAAELPGVTFVNGGYARTTVTGEGTLVGRVLLASALGDVRIDLVIVALGTNDMNGDPRAAVEGLLALRGQAAGGGADTMIATIPPVFTGDAGKSARIAEANAMLGAAVARDHLVDFTTGMTKEDYAPDGVHILESGQRKRAAAVLRALWAL